VGSSSLAVHFEGLPVQYPQLDAVALDDPRLADAPGQQPLTRVLDRLAQKSPS
jgi:hypothetical protein